MRGVLIVFEGCDRSGKSTQCEKVVHQLNLQNIPAEKRHYPNRDTPIGKLLNEYLKSKCDIEDHALHLLFLANMWEEAKEITNTLHSGKTVIVDRYFPSSIVFSAAKDTLDLNWCQKITQGLPKPDGIIYFKISDVNKLNERYKFGEERYEQIDFQKKVVENYEQLSQKEDWFIINALDSVENITDNIERIIKKILCEHSICYHSNK